MKTTSMTQKKNFFQLCFTVLMCIFLSKASAQSIGDFSGIKVFAPIKIILSQSDSNTIRTDAGGDIGEHIQTKIQDDVLHIFLKEKMKNEKTLSVFIGIKSLKSLFVAGTADVISDNQIICDILTIESSGAGNINLDLKANEIITTISGAGDVKLKGSAQSLEATITGAGELKASNLETTKVKVKASGAGNAKINVSKSLDADVSGAGSVIYKGDPADRNVNISGAGSVRQISETGDKSEKRDNHISVDISLDSDITIEEDTLDPDDPDTTRINLKRVKVLIIEKDDEEKTDTGRAKSKKDDHDGNRHWAGLYLGVNGFLTPQNSLNLPAKAGFMDLNYAKSLHFAFNFLEKDIHLHKDYAMLVTGLGVDFNAYALKNNITLQKSNNSVFGLTDTINKFTRNKLKTTFVNVPLLLAFNTNSDPDKGFHIAAGMIFGYAISTKTKQRYDLGGDEINSKIKDDYFINPFRYSATMQVGYGDFNLYASYALNPLFKGAKGPELYPFTVGIRLLGL